jgi:hypothetical protein
MAFIDCTIYGGELAVDIVYPKDGLPIIRAKCGSGYIALSPEEAIQRRDDLSRAITEAATAAAKAVEVVA